jgi:hypothetical protein
MVMSNSPFSRDQISDMIDRINTEGINLTAWEIQFLESITDYFNRGGFLSEKQVEQLERIFSERTS